MISLFTFNYCLVDGEWKCLKTEDAGLADKRYIVNIRVELSIYPSKPVYSVEAEIKDFCGQGIKDINFIARTDVGNHKVFKEIYDLYRKYNRNNNRPLGTEKQEAALKEFPEFKDGSYNFNKAVNYLADKNLLVDNSVKDDNGEGHRYGSRRVYKPIPPEDLERILNLMKLSKDWWKHL